jgi:condensin complex subunit 1
VIKEISLIIQKSNENSQINTQLIKSLISCLLRFHGTSNSEWYSACEEIINCIFHIFQNPEVLAQFILQHLTSYVFTYNSDSSSQRSKTKLRVPDMDVFLRDNTILKMEEEEDVITTEGEKKNDGDEDDEQINFEDALGQCLFAVGQVAIRFLIHFDRIENKLKVQRNEEESKYQSNMRDNNNEDLDKIHGGIEAEFEKKVEALHTISERFLIQKNLLSAYVPWIKKISEDILDLKRGDSNLILDRVVILTLCKFMCVSGDFLKQNLPLLFKFLNSDIDSLNKHNIIICLGDLMHRYPNITEPFTYNLYSK